MRMIKSRRFVAGAAELKLFLVEEEGRLPFRVRMRHSAPGIRATRGVFGGFATEAEGLAALDVHTANAVGAAWTEVPRKVHLALGIPAAPGRVVLDVDPKAPCVHPALRRYPLTPGMRLVCPDCSSEISG